MGLTGDQGGSGESDVDRDLRRSRDLFAGVLDAATEQAIIATDPDGVITVFNTGAERMLGYSAQEMIGTSPERLHDPDEIRDRATQLAMEPGFGVLLARAATGGSETRQWAYITRDGRRLLTLITVTAMHGPGGEVTGFIKVGTDITDRVQAQRALAQSQSRLHAMEHAPIGLAVVGLDLRILEANAAFCHITGYQLDQLLQMFIADAIDPLHAEADEVALERLLRADVESPADVRIDGFGGRLRWVSRSTSMVRGPDGSAAQYIVQVREITQQKLAELALLDKTRRLRDAEIIGRSGSWEVDTASHNVTWSDGLFNIYGMNPDTVSGDYDAAAEAATHPADRLLLRAAFSACAEFGVPYTVRYRLTRPSDGAVRWYEGRAERVIETDRPTRVNGSVVDVTELVHADIKIRAAHTFQQAVLDASPDVILAYQLQERSVMWSNRSLAGVLGFPDQAEELGDRADGEALPGCGVHACEVALLAALDTAGADIAQRDLAVLDAAGEPHWFSLRTTPLRRDDHGVVTELLAILRDVSDAVLAQQRLEYTASHDSLTGLPNRALLINLIDEALIRSQREHREISVLFCDLDGFKLINDTAGHAAGDAVLVETAHRLQEVLRDGDVVARAGGDEFIVLVQPWNRTSPDPATAAVDPDQIPAQDRALAPHIAARIGKALQDPVVVNGVEHVVTVSIGITYPSTATTEKATAADALQDADAAMYLAKSKGKNRFEIFHPGMRQPAGTRPHDADPAGGVTR